MRRRITMLITAAILALTMSLAAALPAFAAQELPAGCSKDKGTITCTSTTEGKNKNFSETTTTTTQGNTENFSPEPQGTGTETGCSDSNPGNSCPPGQFS